MQTESCCDDEMSNVMALNADKGTYKLYREAMIDAGRQPVSFARFVYELRSD